eukprot:TRINITY_DN63326_c0_g1_i1.p1 TRINITY_DN63326_c0_g1~~TRINITY_DN63326_c0_g1_i1.p1  ORF type:complete len:493 (+),score=80.44 TRINITY_DN63326_c0_g1_i1:140-1618(+)
MDDACNSETSPTHFCATTDSPSPLTPSAPSLLSSPGLASSPLRTGDEDSVVHPLQPDFRSGSTFRIARTLAATMVASGASKTVQESAIIMKVRREMEAIEHKLSGQILRVQEQSDRMLNVALSHSDSTTWAMDGMRTNVDTGLGELTSSCLDVSNEVQQTLRRIEESEERQYEWRRQVEDEIRIKLAEIELTHQLMASSLQTSCTANDVVHQRFNTRVLRIEGFMEETGAQIEDARRCLSKFHDRLTNLELNATEFHSTHHIAQAMSVTAAKHGAEGCVEEMGKAIETCLAGYSHKQEELQEVVKVHLAQIEGVEERLKSLMAPSKPNDDTCRGLHDYMESTELEGQSQSVHKRRCEVAERIELIQRKLERHEDLFDETLMRVRKLDDEQRCATQSDGLTVQPSGASLASDVIDVASELQQCRVRLADSESRLEEVCADVRALQHDAKFMSTRFASVEQFNDLCPRVLDQEQTIKDLYERIGRLDVKGRLWS